ncbi:MAG: hypothetical protein HGA84_09680 [Syntrophobacteraceae bacterium]|nr:hypothetical protein [Syntrophobacteraceae bacterium]
MILDCLMAYPKQAGYFLRQCLIWAKNSLVLGRQDYQWQHEPILYGWKDGASHAWYGDRKQTTLKELQGGGKPVLVDCLTLWLSNLLLQETSSNHEERIEALCRRVVKADYPLVLVSNEVGSGIVPENALARRFRDLAGFANQRVAEACRRVTLVVAGLPVKLK